MWALSHCFSGHALCPALSPTFTVRRTYVGHNPDIPWTNAGHIDGHRTQPRTVRWTVSSCEHYTTVEEAESIVQFTGLKGLVSDLEEEFHTDRRGDCDPHAPDTKWPSPHQLDSAVRICPAMMYRSTGWKEGETTWETRSKQTNELIQSRRDWSRVQS